MPYDQAARDAECAKCWHNPAINERGRCTSVNCMDYPCPSQSPMTCDPEPEYMVIEKLKEQLAECNRLREAENRQTAECIKRMRAAVAAAEKATSRAEVAEKRVKEVEALWEAVKDRVPTAHNCGDCINPECSAADQMRETFCSLFMGRDYYEEPG